MYSDSPPSDIQALLSDSIKIEPYKRELLDLWGYADRETADASGEAIYEQYVAYREAEEFSGMDMARKYTVGRRHLLDEFDRSFRYPSISALRGRNDFRPTVYLRMGYTRAMRYARYPGGRKYEDSEAQRASDSERAKPASNGVDATPNAGWITTSARLPWSTRRGGTWWRETRSISG